jgi:hypothetical protein
VETKSNPSNKYKTSVKTKSNPSNSFDDADLILFHRTYFHFSFIIWSLNQTKTKRFRLKLDQFKKKNLSFITK